MAGLQPHGQFVPEAGMGAGDCPPVEWAPLGKPIAAKARDRALEAAQVCGVTRSVQLLELPERATATPLLASNQPRIVAAKRGLDIDEEYVLREGELRIEDDRDAVAMGTSDGSDTARPFRCSARFHQCAIVDINYIVRRTKAGGFESHMGPWVNAREPWHFNAAPLGTHVSHSDALAVPLQNGETKRRPGVVMTCDVHDSAAADLLRPSPLKMHMAADDRLYPAQLRHLPHDGRPNMLNAKASREIEHAIRWRVAYKKDFAPAGRSELPSEMRLRRAPCVERRTDGQSLVGGGALQAEDREPVDDERRPLEVVAPRLLESESVVFQAVVPHDACETMSCALGQRAPGVRSGTEPSNVVASVEDQIRCGSLGDALDELDVLNTEVRDGKDAKAHTARTTSAPGLFTSSPRPQTARSRRSLGRAFDRGPGDLVVWDSARRGSTFAAFALILSSVTRVLVCRTAWMDFYRGVSADKPVGGGAYVNEEGFGHEIFNFKPGTDGRFRGYVRPPGAGPVRDQRINIDRLGANRGDHHIDGVTVFWAATNPSLGGTRIAGWYDAARVYRNWRPSPKAERAARNLPNDTDAGFMVESASVRLLASDDRALILPRAVPGTTGMGQANVWYPPADWAKRLLEYKAKIEGTKPAPKPSPRPPRMQDTEARLRIEREAMAAAIQWCVERELPYEDVSLKKLGWDLQAGEGKAILRIEVKGSSLPIGKALLELTPNEFAKMTEHRESYRLAVVSVSGSNTDLVMFAWSGEAGAWIGRGGGTYALKLHEVVSARVEVCKDS